MLYGRRLVGASEDGIKMFGETKMYGEKNVRSWTCERERRNVSWETKNWHRDCDRLRPPSTIRSRSPLVWWTTWHLWEMLPYDTCHQPCPRYLLPALTHNDCWNENTTQMLVHSSSGECFMIIWSSNLRFGKRQHSYTTELVTSDIWTQTPGYTFLVWLINIQY